MNVDRRTVLAASGVVAAGAALAACSGSSGAASTSAGGAAGATTAAGGASSASAAGALATTAQVPVTGGFVNADAATVVTQPAEGDFKAFSAICTHQGCLVSSVENNNIVCPCHGSIFSAQDGSVVQGPATQPLAEKPVKVEGGDVLPA